VKTRTGRSRAFSLVAIVILLAVVAPLAGCGTTAVRPAATNVHWVRLEKVVNARDLGGWTLQDGTKIPYGRVFRTGKLSKASAADLAALGKLGIRTSIDLRSKPEVLVDGSDPVGAGKLSGTTSAPIAGVASEDGYSDLVKNQKSSLAAVFRALANGATYPVIIHCTAGKDRTGVVCALLMELLGVPRAQIVEEYLLSSQSGAVNADWLEGALNEVDAAGGINKYLAGIGIDSSMQSAIKKEILGH
jgi:protein-tyrosine phosphatase